MSFDKLKGKMAEAHVSQDKFFKPSVPKMQQTDGVTTDKEVV